jgi:hypothetical protein
MIASLNITLHTSRTVRTSQLMVSALAETREAVIGADSSTAAGVSDVATSLGGTFAVGAEGGGTETDERLA